MMMAACEKAENRVDANASGKAMQGIEGLNG
jgi:hypothetical protein